MQLISYSWVHPWPFSYPIWMKLQQQPRNNALLHRVINTLLGRDLFYFLYRLGNVERLKVSAQSLGRENQKHTGPGHWDFLSSPGLPLFFTFHFFFVFFTFTKGVLLSFFLLRPPHTFIFLSSGSTCHKLLLTPPHFPAHMKN